MKWLIAFSALVLSGATLLAADVLYVSPQGKSNAAGTREDPVSWAAAVNRASSDGQLREIILAGGEYAGSFDISPRVASAAACAPLLIRPADGEKPILHNAVRIADAEAVPGSPGLYRTKTLPPALAHVWERDTRARYISLATSASVAAYPGSAFADQEGKWLYLRTSDGKPPSEHQVWLSLCIPNGRVLGIYRPKTTIEGLTIRDYVGDGHGLVINGPSITARRCRLENCNIGIAVGGMGKDDLIEDCAFLDVGQGIRSNGADLAVKRCRIEKKRDTFLIPVYTALDTGVYFYYPAVSGSVTDTFISGYRQGIRVKTGNGRDFVFRHNTIVDNGEGEAFSWVSAWPNSDCSYNVISRAKDFISLRNLALDPSVRMDYNLFWMPTQLEQYARMDATLRGTDRGKHNVLADPRFVDPANGDYRLLPDSPAAVYLKDADGRPAGAFPAATVEAAAQARPTLELGFEADTTPYGAFGVLTFDRDPWIGGGTTHVRDLADPDGRPRRLTGVPELAVLLRAADPAGRIVKARLTVGTSAPVEMDYSPRITVKLPDKDGEHPVRFEVQNDRNVWSLPVTALIRLGRVPPALIGNPEVIANDHGLIVTFRTSRPCNAEVQFGSSETHGHSVKAPPLVKRAWEAGDGGEWVETWTIPRTEFALAILNPGVEVGQKVHFRVVLTDEAGVKSQSSDFTSTVRGKARILYIAKDGEDGPDRGGRNAPYRSLQYAVDRALPGDKVVVMPGLYTEGALITHGGLNEKTPLTIEGESPGTVTFDCAKREYSIVALERAPYVTVRNIRFLYYKKAGVYAYRSPHVTIERCVFFNGLMGPGYHAYFGWSPYGTVTRCLAIGGETALEFLQSPNATVTHNTISHQLYCAASYDYSLAGTVQTNNAFCFAGNDMFSGCWQHPEEIKTFRSDYNNLGTDLVPHNVATRKPDDPLLTKIKAQQFKYDYGRNFNAGSKHIVSIDKVYCLMEDWQAAYGQDRHSLFADPKFVKPALSPDSWDWSVKPDSPNASAGEKRTTIGAFGND